MKEGNYYADMFFKFPSGDIHPMRVRAVVKDSVCRVKKITMSERIIFSEVNLNSKELVPTNIVLP